MTETDAVPVAPAIEVNVAPPDTQQETEIDIWPLLNDSLGSQSKKLEVIAGNQLALTKSLTESNEKTLQMMEGLRELQEKAVAESNHALLLAVEAKLEKLEKQLTDRLTASSTPNPSLAETPLSVVESAVDPVEVPTDKPAPRADSEGRGAQKRKRKRL
ncbi:MAG: hypothetical protein ACP5EP_12240 [Acidobacteriaceae bacterium]